MIYKTAAGMCPLEEEWFMSFKSTPYEDVAYQLLSDLYSLDLERSTYNSVMDEKYRELDNLEYQLKALQLDALRAAPIGKEIIVIHANLTKRSWFGEAQEVQDVMDAFIGSPQESEALKLVKGYLDLKQDINKFEEDSGDFWDREEAIRNQMESLSMEALQSNIEDKIPTTGLEAFPAMAGELAELMQGVSMDTPLEPTTFTAAKEKPKFVPVEERIIEFEDTSETLPEDRLKFEKGDKVTLTKSLDAMSAGGTPHTFAKGTSGEISSQFDGQGQVYMVRFDGGGLVMVPSDHLK